MTDPTESLIKELYWFAATFDTVIHELKKVTPTREILMVNEMSEVGRDTALRYARILNQCVVVPLTDMLGGEK
jgi:hypothetical protein